MSLSTIMVVRLLTILLAVYSCEILAQEPSFDWARTVKADIRALVVDSKGNTLSSGTYSGWTDFGDGPFEHVLTSSGGSFIQKVDPFGKIIWVKSIHGQGGASILAMDVDDEGNMLIAGNISDTVDIDPGPGVQYLVGNGNSNLFVAKLDSDGNLMWAAVIEGEHEIICNSIVFDHTDNVLLTGSYWETVDFDPGIGIFELSPVFGRDLFILKLSPSGELVWGKSIGGVGSGDSGNSLVADSDGNIFVTGNFSDTVDFDPGSGGNELISNGNSDIFTLKLDSAGQLDWVIGNGGSVQDRGKSISIDNQGDILIGGTFGETVDFDPGPGILIYTSGNFTAFIQKIDKEGHLIWAKAIGSGNNSLSDMAIDNVGDVYATGSFHWTIDFDPGPGLSELIPKGMADIYTLKLDAFGDFLWAQSFGADENDFGRKLIVDHKGNVFVAGTFSGIVDFDPGPDTINHGFLFEGRSFLLKLEPCPVNTDADILPFGNGLGADATAAIYQWLDCSNGHSPIIGATNQSFFPVSNGDYSVEVTENGCTDTSACYSVLNVGIAENGFGTEFAVYPNPTKGGVTVDLGHEYQNVTITIRNVLGQVVSTINYDLIDKTIIELKGSAGVYFVDIVKETSAPVTIKIVKD